MSPRPVSVHHTLLQTIDINLIATFIHSSLTVMSILVEPSSPSYVELVVPIYPQWLSPPDARVEVTAHFLCSVREICRVGIRASASAEKNVAAATSWLTRSLHVGTSPE
jgi:hypothetical protein